MKNFVLSIFLLGLIFTMVSCASAPPEFYGSDLVARQGESEIILNSRKDYGTLYVYVNEELKQTMKPRDTIRIILPDGEHTILVNWIAKNGWGMDMPVNGEPLVLNLESKIYVFNIKMPYFLIGTKVTLEPDKSMLENR